MFFWLCLTLATVTWPWWVPFLRLVLREIQTAAEIRPADEEQVGCAPLQSRAGLRNPAWDSGHRVVVRDALRRTDRVPEALPGPRRRPGFRSS